MNRHKSAHLPTTAFFAIIVMLFILLCVGAFIYLFI